jgi:hypothetical protein
VEDEHLSSVHAIEDTTGRLDDLSIAVAGQFRRLRTARWKSPQLLDVAEHALDQRRGGFRVVQSDVVGDGVEVTQRRLRPDYFSHRAMRAFAFA